MIVNVPSRLSGFGGLGDCVVGAVDPDTGDTIGGCGISIDPSTNIFTEVPFPTGSGIYPPPGYTCVADAGGQCVDTPIPINPGTTSSGGLTQQQLSTILNAATNALNIENQATQPHLIPGTNVLYNPATGQIVSGVGSGVSLSGSGLTLGNSSLLVMGAIGLVALMLVSSMLGKK